MKKIILLLISNIFLISFLFAQNEKSDLSNARIEICEKKEFFKLQTSKDLYAISNDKKIAFVDNTELSYSDKTIVFYANNKIEKSIDELDSRIYELSFSKDSRYFVFGTYKRDKTSLLKIIDLQTGNELQVENEDYNCAFLDFAPDKKQFVYTRRMKDDKSRNFQLVISDFEGNKKMICTEANFPKWSPVDNKIAFCRTEPKKGVGTRGWNNYIWIYDIESGTEKKLVNSKGMAIATMSWSPNGKKIVSHDGDNIALIDVSNDKRIEFGDEGAHHPVWSPDGSKILYAQLFMDGERLINMDIFITDSDGCNIKNVTNTEDINEDNPFWISNNEFIVIIANKLYSLNIE